MEQVRTNIFEQIEVGGGDEYRKSYVESQEEKSEFSSMKKQKHTNHDNFPKPLSYNYLLCLLQPQLLLSTSCL